MTVKKKKNSRMGTNPLEAVVPDMTDRESNKSPKVDKNKDYKKPEIKSPKNESISAPRKKRTRAAKGEMGETAYWPKVGFRYKPELIELLEWAVYCTKKTRQELLNEALESYLKNLDIPKKPLLSRGKEY